MLEFPLNSQYQVQGSSNVRERVIAEGKRNSDIDLLTMKTEENI
jgi:hypothetical protein